MPLLIYVMVRWIDPYYMSYSQADRFVFLLLTINVLAPAVSMLIMLRYGMINSIQLQGKEERTGPYLITLFYYIASYVLLRWRDPGFPHEVFSFFLSVIVSLSAALLINHRWKISVHMIAQGGIAGTLLGVYAIHRADISFALICAMITAALTASARIYLNAHKPSEVYWGFAAGLLITWIITGCAVVI
jgi:hypothetical protein